METLLRQIREQVSRLEERKPFSWELQTYIEEMNRIDWIYSSLHLSGSTVTKAGVAKIAQGEFLADASLGEHGFIRHYMETFPRIRGMLGMGTELSPSVLLELHRSIFPDEEEIYRSDNPVLRELSYNPPHFKEIEEQMVLLFRSLASASERLKENPILFAAYAHNKIIEVYPFAKHTETLARVGLLYVLMSKNLPPIQLGFSVEEYHEAVRLYLKKDEINPFYHVIERGVYNKLEVLLQLTQPQED